jgi:hypothetical protein
VAEASADPIHADCLNRELCQAAKLEPILSIGQTDQQTPLS